MDHQAGFFVEEFGENIFLIFFLRGGTLTMTKTLDRPQADLQDNGSDPESPPAPQAAVSPATAPQIKVNDNLLESLL